MKKALRNMIVFLLIAAVCVSLSSCNVFKTMRENAERASMIEILASPDDAEAARTFRELLDVSAGQADVIHEDVSYRAGNPSVQKDGEDAGLLDDAAKQIRDLIMEGKPGHSSEDLTADDLHLLKTFDPLGAKDIIVDRNYDNIKVTDDKGNETVDENGEVITERVIGDNILHLTMEYFTTTVTDTKTNGEGETEDVTEIVPADGALLNDVFGGEADKAAVLEAFGAVADYVKVNDYTISYTDSRVTSDLSLDEDIVTFVKFEKNMTVTALVTCLGKLADYGDVTVTFPLTKTAEYSFSYPAAE